MTIERYANNAASTLDSSINNSVTSLDVVDASTFPSAGQFRILIGSEILLVTGVSSNTFTVTRGAESTAAASHTAGDPVTQILTKEALDTIFADNIQLGAIASRPAAGRAGRIYHCNDYPMLFRDNGSSWDAVYRGRTFTQPSMTGYTQTDGGATATVTTITNGPLVLSVQQTLSGDKWTKWVKALAATPVSITHRFEIASMMQTNMYGGLMMGDGTKFAACYIICLGTSISLAVDNWNSLTSINGSLVRIQGTTNWDNVWLRMTDDGTNRISYFSTDGITFNPFHTVGRTAFVTATEGGFGIGTNQTLVPVTIKWLGEF